MGEPALYRDIDGEMKPFAALSHDGYHHNLRTGAFTQGNCRGEGHVYARELASAKPPVRERQAAGARVPALRRATGCRSRFATRVDSSFNEPSR
jgi:hypothetical protein